MHQNFYISLLTRKLLDDTWMLPYYQLNFASVPLSRTTAPRPSQTCQNLYHQGWNKDQTTETSTLKPLEDKMCSRKTNHCFLCISLNVFHSIQSKFRKMCRCIEDTFIGWLVGCLTSHSTQLVVDIRLESHQNYSTMLQSYNSRQPPLCMA